MFSYTFVHPAEGRVSDLWEHRRHEYVLEDLTFPTFDVDVSLGCVEVKGI